MSGAGRSRVERAARAAGLVLVCTLAVRAFGLLKEMVIAARFGVGPEMDAFNVAFIIPMMLVAMITPALSGALIPVMAARELSDGRDAARTRRAWGSLFLLTLLGLGGLVIVLSLLSPALGGLLGLLGRVGGGRTDTVDIPLTRHLLLALLPLALLQVAAALETSLFHVHKRFLLPSLAPVFFSVTVIAGLLVLAEPRVTHLAYASLGGSLLWMLSLLPYFGRHASFRLRPEAELIRAIAAKLLPLVAIMGFIQLAEVFCYLLGAAISVGTAASLGYAQRLVDSITLVVGTAIPAAALPFLSDSAARKDLSELGRIFEKGVCQVAVLMVPVTAGWLVFGRQVLASLYQQGAFDAEATRMTLGPLLMLALGGAFKPLGLLGAQAFMALRKLRPLIFFGLTSLVIITALAVLLGRTHGATGLALALTCGTLYGSLGVLSTIKRRLGPRLRLLRIGGVLLRTAAAAAAAGLAGHFSLSSLPAGTGPSSLWVLVVAGTVFGAAYLVCCRLFGVRLRDFGLRLPGRR